MNDQIKVLCLDIENFPCLVYSWGLGEVNIPLEFLKRDWSICAWSAKWVGSDKIYYMDNRGKKNVYDDRELVAGLIKLINEADVIIGQNVRSFDLRKIRARAKFHGFKPFKPCKVTDILTEERKVFAWTSHKLAYKTTMNVKYQKLEHKEFPGFSLWEACMENVTKAWRSMQEYCEYDVLSTEERYLDVRGWIKTHHLGPVDGQLRCKCGSTNLRRKGFAFTDAAKYQIYQCQDCGKWPRGVTNLLTKHYSGARLREAA